MAIVRQYEGESLEERVNPTRKVIRYWVPGELTSNDAIAEVKATAGFDYGDTDPDGATNLKITGYRATQRMGAGSQQGFMVEVQFGATGTSADFQPTPDQDPDYKVVEYTTERRRLTMPVFKEVQVAWSDGTTITNTTDWVRDDREFEETFQIVRVRVNVTNPPGNALATQVRAQINKVHQIYGATDEGKWRFIGANASQINAGTWRITYEWEGDNGSAEPTNANADNGTLDTAKPILLPPAREPYHDYEARLEPLAGPVIGPAFEPVIETTRIFAEDPTGAIGFPGAPLGAL